MNLILVSSTRNAGVASELSWLEFGANNSKVAGVIHAWATVSRALLKKEKRN